MKNRKRTAGQEKVLNLLFVLIILWFILMIYGFFQDNAFYYSTGDLGFVICYLARLIWNK